jgi:hypothetical protein
MIRLGGKLWYIGRIGWLYCAFATTQRCPKAIFTALPAHPFENEPLS